MAIKIDVNHLDREFEAKFAEILPKVWCKASGSDIAMFELLKAEIMNLRAVVTQQAGLIMGMAYREANSITPKYLDESALGNNNSVTPFQGNKPDHLAGESKVIGKLQRKHYFGPQVVEEAPESNVVKLKEEFIDRVHKLNFQFGACLGFGARYSDVINSHVFTKLQSLVQSTLLSYLAAINNFTKGYKHDIFRISDSKVDTRSVFIIGVKEKFVSKNLLNGLIINDISSVLLENGFEFNELSVLCSVEVEGNLLDSSLTYFVCLAKVFPASSINSSNKKILAPNEVPEITIEDKSYAVTGNELTNAVANFFNEIKTQQAEPHRDYIEIIQTKQYEQHRLNVQYSVVSYLSSFETKENKLDKVKLYSVPGCQIDGRDIMIVGIKKAGSVDTIYNPKTFTGIRETLESNNILVKEIVVLGNVHLTDKFAVPDCDYFVCLITSANEHFNTPVVREVPLFIPPVTAEERKEKLEAAFKPNEKQKESIEHPFNNGVSVFEEINKQVMTTAIFIKDGPDRRHKLGFEAAHLAPVLDSLILRHVGYLDDVAKHAFYDVTLYTHSSFILNKSKLAIIRIDKQVEENNIFYELNKTVRAIFGVPSLFYIVNEFTSEDLRHDLTKRHFVVLLDI